jgi:hypothetical protein
MISKLSAHLGPTSLFSGGSAPSLVLHLDAGNTFSYTGTGSTWYDLTSFNNDISLTNATFSSTYNNLAKFEGSFEFNGIDSFGSLISGTAIPLMNSHYTIESWIQANTYDVTEDGGIIGWGSYSNNYEVNALRQSGGGFKNYWWGTDLEAIPGTTPSVDYWYHLAATYDGTNRTIYLNGQSLETDIPGVTHSVSSFSNLTVGVTNTNEFFNGRISTIKVWNKNLNSTQLLSSFNSNKSKYGYDFGSMTFNDTQNAYLISTSNDYAFDTNDFTVEAFFKATATASYSYAGIVSLRNNATYNNGVNINLQSANTSAPLIEFSAGGNFLTYTASIDEWYHVAISRTGGTSSLFVNGNLFNEVADTLSYGNNDLVVGRYHTTVNDYYFNGLISNVRVINGTGLYTGTFSIPSVQLSGTYSNTKFLITSQEVNPSKDMIGLHSVTPSNIGWTSSLPTFVPDVVIDSSLQFYVDAGQVSSYSGTGTTWYDISGNSRNLTMNSLSYSSNNGGYIIFDGSHTAESGSTYTISFSNGFTVESVAKFSSLGSEGLFAFNGGGDFINIQAQGNNIRWEVESGQSFTSTNTLSSNTWYHFTCVYEGDSNNTSGTAIIYINGVENATNSLLASRIGQNQTSDFILGLWDGYLTGNIALSRMYNRVLTPSEVLQNFNATRSRYGL